MEDNTQELTAQIETLNAQIEELKQKYIERFFNAGNTSEETISDEPDETIETEDVTIDDLFEDDEKKDEA